MNNEIGVKLPPNDLKFLITSKRSGDYDIII